MNARTMATAATVPLAMALLLLVGATAADAQTLTGRVVDARTGEPVRLATVAILRDDRTVAGSLVDESGAFRIALPGPDVYTLRVTNQGYATFTIDELRADSRADLALAEIRLDPDPVRLQEVLVETSAGRLRGQEKVRRRQLLGTGTFFSGADLVRERPASLTEYLAEHADLEVRYDVWGDPYLWSPIGPSHCLVVQVNHWPLSTLGYRSLDEIRLSRVAAIEVYNTVADVPPESDLIRWTREPRRFPGERCGLVNVWFWRAW